MRHGLNSFLQFFPWHSRWPFQDIQIRSGTRIVLHVDVRIRSQRFYLFHLGCFYDADTFVRDIVKKNDNWLLECLATSSFSFLEIGRRRQKNCSWEAGRNKIRRIIVGSNNIPDPSFPARSFTSGPANTAYINYAASHVGFSSCFTQNQIPPNRPRLPSIFKFDV